MKRQEILNQVELILELKGQGWPDVKIRKHLGLHEKSWQTRLEYLRKEAYFRERALTLCMETVHRLHDARQRLMLDYEKYKSERKYYAANQAIGKVVDIDLQIPKVCQQLGFIETEATNIRITVDNPELKHLTDEELQQQYRALLAKPT